MQNTHIGVLVTMCEGAEFQNYFLYCLSLSSFGYQIHKIHIIILEEYWWKISVSQFTVDLLHSLRLLVYQMLIWSDNIVNFNFLICIVFSKYAVFTHSIKQKDSLHIKHLSELSLYLVAFYVVDSLLLSTVWIKYKFKAFLHFRKSAERLSII